MKVLFCGLWLVLLLLAGCTQKMATEGHLQGGDPSPEGGSQPLARRPPEHTIAQEQSIEPLLPPATTLTLLKRGRERFEIHCAPCHGYAGYGDGMVVQRGFLAPPSYHQERLRQAPDRHLFEVITQGYGAMTSYATRVAEADRWAIVAYIRALQLSQDAPIARLSSEDRARLQRLNP